MNKWIFFNREKKDKRLENHKLYLVSDGKEIGAAYYNCSTFFIWTEKKFNVTHWMRLPLPPENDE